MSSGPKTLIDLSKLRVAIVHDWLVDYGGAERVLSEIVKLFPQGDLFSLVDFYDDDQRKTIENKRAVTSFIQKLPRAKKHYRKYLPLMPLAIEQFDLSAYDLVISSSHAVAKGVITGPDQLHICMCYSPMRYAWDLTHQYLRESGLDSGIEGWLTKYILHRIRMWDHRTSNGVDEFISISEFIGRRIKKAYGRQSTLIYPPVDTDAFALHPEKDDFYFTASRMVPYKHIDMIAEAFSKMPDKKLVVIGDGPDFRKIKAKAGANVTMMGYQPFDVMRDHMQRAKAFVFAAEEDFGIIPIEAQACGTPVIAYGKGGALETVIENETGLFFYEQSSEAIVKAVHAFENGSTKLEPATIRANALRFSKDRFRREFRDFVQGTVDAYHLR